MERRRDGVDRPPSRRCRDHPSFSSTLLDAIYRSIDETDDIGATKVEGTGRATDRLRSIPVPSTKKQSSGVTGESRRSISKNEQPVSRCRQLPDLAPVSSSSSDCSSYGGFSSSDAESVSARLRPIRTSEIAAASFPARSDRFFPAAARPHPPPAGVSSVGEVKRKKERYGSIRSRLRELKQGRTPASPGARIASFLNSLFAAKSKVSAGSGSGEESTCSTASSYSRSCLSKTAPTPRGQPAAVKRTVRFCPVSVIVDEDCRPCGQKWIYGCDPQTAPQPPVRSAAAMLIRRSQMGKEEEEEDDGESDSSSDLFELENLTVIGRYGDELPVYETTRLANYRSVSHGLIL
ncbi:hypothetical protein AXF42_Ash017105 [Apostasia shenzhenica]|uniref:Protein BIG GRAIN 1-like A n=1 Tax=Apostasia shenzhenica TaxID=1088818 RepID=A0A2H9ZV47_9ASPA|nr:hypothetical protein AXF42_Ash017105 [Apostasia shenzhenica]